MEASRPSLADRAAMRLTHIFDQLDTPHDTIQHAKHKACSVSAQQTQRNKNIPN